MLRDLDKPVSGVETDMPEREISVLRRALELLESNSVDALRLARGEIYLPAWKTADVA